MPTSRRNVVGFAVVGVLLGVFFNPFSTSATPMITQEFVRSPTASESNPDSQSPNMRGMQIFDIVFALSESFIHLPHILISVTHPALFIFLTAFILCYKSCLSFVSLGVPMVADCDCPSLLPNFPRSSYLPLFYPGLRAAYRHFLRTLSHLHPDNLLQSWAEALGVVGTDGARASATDGGDASPSTQPTPQPISANPQPEVVATTHDCATAASDHRHRASSESA
jgi:hypothetical protein